MEKHREKNDSRVFQERGEGSFKKEVKSGSQTSFWFDNWSQLGKIYDLTDQRGLIDIGIPITATVEEAVKNRRRRRHRANHLIAIENLLLQQEHILVNEEEDKPLWKQSEDTYKDHFNSKKTWSQLTTVFQVVGWSEAIWFKHSTPKYSFLAWLEMLNRLSTGDRMTKWDAATNPVCVLCNATDETKDHLYFECDYSREIWRKLMSKLLENRYVEDWRRVILLLMDKDQTKLITFFTRYAFQVAVYSIWRERNGRRHGESPRNVQKMVQWIDKEVRNRMSTIRMMGDMKYDEGFKCG